MLTKGYPALQGCSCDFPRLTIGPLGVPKPYRTSSYSVPSLLTRSIVCFISWILWDQTQTQKVLISSETMGHRMRMVDTVLESPNVILLVLESHRNIPLTLGNINFGQHLLNSLLTKFSRNMSITNTFEDS